MSASPEIEAETMPGNLADGDNAAACFAQYQSGPHDMQVEAEEPLGQALSVAIHGGPPAPLSMENCGPPGGSGQDLVNGCEP